MKKIVLLFFVSLFFLLLMFPLTRESTSFSEATIYTLYVVPSTNDVSVGNTFVVNVSLADYVYLETFVFYLGYNTTILDGLNVSIPPPFEPIEGEVQINDTDGYVHVFAAYGGPIPSSASASESFPLASITFKATAVGSSILNLYDTLLFGGFGTYIDHTTVNGSVTVSSGIITVPDDYPTIQGAINAANPGDTICVYNGTYYENVVVNKTVSLIGENKYDTIIDGAYTGTVIEITASNVKITGFTVRNSGSTYPDSGIRLETSSGKNISNNIITNNKFGIFVIYSSKNVLTGNIVSNNLHGIELMYSSENVLINNNASSNNAGVYLYGAHNNILTNNTVTNNNFGAVISHSGDNVIFNNVFSDNEWTGIRVLEQSSGNLLFDNNASSNLDGFEFTYVNDNTLVNNVASYNRRDGIQVGYSNSNVLISNEVSKNTYGIRVSESSSNNTIYHNNFINNTWQAYILHSPLNTMWDDGYPSGGNYWSDYTGVDVKSGPNQDQPSSDGIGDTAYVIDANNIDHYPLMNIWSSPPPDTTSPNITDISQIPFKNNVLPEDEVKVNATVTDELSGVKQVTLNYTNGNGTWTTVNMTNLVGNVWNATTPAFPYGTNVTYRIIAEDNMNNTITTEDLGDEYQYTVIPEFPTWTSILLILIVLTVAIAIYKRRLLKTSIH